MKLIDLFKMKNENKKKLFKGSVDQLKDGVVYGWAGSFDNKPIEVKVYVNELFVGSLHSKIYRDDLYALGMGNGCLGFELDISDKIVSGSNTIQITAVDVDDAMETIVDKKVFFLDVCESSNEIVHGNIDKFVGGLIHGWIGCMDKEVYPYVTANGKPCKIEAIGIERKDVEKKVGLNSNTGFIARLPEMKFGSINFELSAISMTSFKFVDRKKIKCGVVAPDSISYIYKALEISKKKNSVGIVVWEGTHNPIGRAQVLYNIIKEKRPAVVISFNIGFSNEPIWKPLLNSDCFVLMLPWKQRDIYAELFREIEFNFDLVWICKPRYPAFVLAKYVSHENTKYIMDFDDNEIEMSSTLTAIEKPYGLLSSKIAQRYIDKIVTRSVASQSLKNDFGGEFVRHARYDNKTSRDREIDIKKPIRVGFIGTVRSHKGIVKAAKAINDINNRKGYSIKFVIGGIYDPITIRSELLALGCEIHDDIDSSRLSYHIQNLDVVITGFPDDLANKEIVKYQISSKIGDALSNKRTVLVPEGDSVADLAEIPGVYLFNDINFERMLENAIRHQEEVVMDEQFTIDWNYLQFVRLEKQAYENKLTPKELFDLNWDYSVFPEACHKKKVLLIWKQHDIGLYGRRIDHIARTLCEQGIEVTCLEFINQKQFIDYDAKSERIDVDSYYITNDLRNKFSGYCKDGINYKAILTNDDVEIEFKRFLLHNRIMPNNSKVILFPAVPEWKAILKVIDGYSVICDVVDNQLSWEKKHPLNLLCQYKTIMDISDSVIFNSKNNFQFFSDMGFLKDINCHIIPNWYKLPLSYSELSNNIDRNLVKNECFNIVYSGNMNDRFDWDLVLRIPKEIDLPLKIHLIGNCQRSINKMGKILDDKSIIYHGVMRELELLNFLKGCDLAIMPHVIDEHSNFMNPMKVMMYEKIYLPCVSTKVAGIDVDNNLLKVCDDAEEFIHSVREKLVNSDISSTEKYSDSEERYIKLVGLTD